MEQKKTATQVIMEEEEDKALKAAENLKRAKPKKKARPKRKAGRSRDVRSGANWVPILRVNAYDFDEEAGKFLDSSQTVELQQDTASKRIRAIVIPD